MPVVMVIVPTVSLLATTYAPDIGISNFIEIICNEAHCKFWGDFGGKLDEFMYTKYSAHEYK